MMSPAIALHDPVFRAYVVLVAGTLLVSGAVLFLLRQTRPQLDLAPIWQTYRSWLVMAPLALVVVFWGRAAVITGVSLLGIFGFREYARAAGLSRDGWIMGAVYLGIVALGATCLLRPLANLPGAAVPLFAIALILVLPVLRNRARGELRVVSLGVVGFVYLGWMLGHLGFLTDAVNAYGYVCYVVFATELNDVVAFTCGRLFGRHPLRSEISPRKTWEGTVGALAFSLVLPWLLRFSFPFFGPLQLLLTGLIVGLGGPLGDLSISVLKRELGAKDMAATIPGHGGLLDRIDSLLYVAPLFVYLVAKTVHDQPQ